MSQKPTLRQLQTLSAIQRLSKRLGRAPSIAELGNECGLRDAYAIRSVLAKLARDDLVTVPRMVQQGELRVTAAGKLWL